MGAVRVVLVGAHGHGRAHLRNIRRLVHQGGAELVGLCDLVPVPAAELDGLGEPVQSGDLADLLARTRPDIAVIATPIQTHAELAVRALSAGAHVLLEKPPAPRMTEFERILAGVAESGRACQIGFQSLGSQAVPAVRALLADGVIGRVRGIGVAGAWPRDEAYFRRSAWSGRRRIGDVDVVDGALTNPFAHAVATALAVDGSERRGEVDRIELELFHANPIESDDTSCLRLRTARGTVITVAVSLCAPHREEPYLVVHGEEGTLTFRYTLDEVTVRRDGEPERARTHPRTDLLENLIDHVRAGQELLVPPERTGAFMQVLEAVRLAPDPLPIPDSAQLVAPSRIDAYGAAEGAPHRVLPGIHQLVAASANQLALFSELGVTWAAPAADRPAHRQEAR